MVMDKTGLDCVECERLDNEFISARKKMIRLKLPGKEATVPVRIAEKLEEAELAALSAYKDHRIGH